MILLLVFLGVVLAVGTYVLLTQLGVVPTFSGQRGTPREPEAARSPAGYTRPTPAAVPSLRAPRLRELPQGCLISLIVAGVVWFALWGVVLVMAFRFLQTPYRG